MSYYTIRSIHHLHYKHRSQSEILLRFLPKSPHESVYSFFLGHQRNIRIFRLKDNLIERFAPPATHLRSKNTREEGIEASFATEATGVVPSISEEEENNISKITEQPNQRECNNNPKENNANFRLLLLLLRILRRFVFL
mmetsp:Transcript_8114/g.14296  ORF Transcript_8114/g.14296 Transcript_8114/m.14296 type:complete len:139 (+) Transcript_8114:145-561(+)